ncbi:hypothetical protein KP509_02G025800 [Ceratopteris richardii]|uniref:Uncharacterized protein n=1 Tax=Ceratopteris richardii TaxID=49495 RepID=A0A8T2V423_CERRI|nr:hypothetical protein KP509_02G025800 [Ceratopteris richardii]
MTPLTCTEDVKDVANLCCSFMAGRADEGGACSFYLSLSLRSQHIDARYGTRRQVPALANELHRLPSLCQTHTHTQSNVLRPFLQSSPIGRTRKEMGCLLSLRFLLHRRLFKEYFGDVLSLWPPRVDCRLQSADPRKRSMREVSPRRLWWCCMTKTFIIYY